MQPQKIALLVIMILSAAELLSSIRHPQRVGRAGLRILIKARENPQLAEGLVRYLLWELAVWRGLDVEVSLEFDATCSSCDEIQAIQAILLEEGLVGPAHDLSPDLVFVV
jgi:hypothetical protein